MQRADPTTVDARPAIPVNAVWRTLRGYILWQHERGTLHYDIMVTLILIFIFISPRVINYNDKPGAHNPHPTGIVVSTDGQGHLIYQVSASTISAGDGPSTREQLLRVIEPISGSVSIISYEAIADGRGHVQSYRVIAKRE